MLAVRRYDTVQIMAGKLDSLVYLGQIYILLLIRAKYLLQMPLDITLFQKDAL